jgi:hypothetical protein
MVNYTSPATTAISDTRPAESDGKVWVDTSENPPEMKLYDSATGAFIPASAKETIVSQTEPTPEVGKIWFEPAQFGTNMYAASSTSWEFLKFLTTIPDSENLRARYDWREANGTDTVQDLTDNGNDLTGTYSGPSATIDGVQAGDFDGDDDLLTVDFSSSLTEPYHIFFLVELQDNSGEQSIWGVNPAPSSGFINFGDDDGTYEWMKGGGGDTTLGSSDTNAHVFNTLIDGSNSELRIDSTDTGSGDPSSSGGIDGLAVGARADDVIHANMHIVEMLVYEVDESANETDIEEYLDRDTSLI